jgi:hypothetical protein
MDRMDAVVGGIVRPRQRHPDVDLRFGGGLRLVPRHALAIPAQPHADGKREFRRPGREAINSIDCAVGIVLRAIELMAAGVAIIALVLMLGAWATGYRRMH